MDTSAAGTKTLTTLMLRLVLFLPLPYAAYRAVRILTTPWCQLIDHAPVRDPEAGLVCTRCGHILASPDP